jgi:nicotinamidase-related amidase
MTDDVGNSPANPGWRSPLLLCPERSLLVVVDVQEKLLPAISDSASILANIRFLLDAAQILNVRTVITEQYPKGLGPTLTELSVHPVISARLEKLRFSAAEVLRESGEFRTPAPAAPLQLVLTGIETHVCVQQTALDLISQGVTVTLATDAVGSRRLPDHVQSLRRMEVAGVTLTTVESIAFEWCEAAGTERFKALSRLIKTRDR